MRRGERRPDRFPGVKHDYSRVKFVSQNFQRLLGSSIRKRASTESSSPRDRRGRLVAELRSNLPTLPELEEELF